MKSAISEPQRKNAISEEQRDRIATASPEETDQVLAKELNLGESTIRKYRRKARLARREVTQRVVEQRIEAELPNALDALAFVLKTAKAEYEGSREVAQGRLLKDAAVDLIRYGGIVPEKDPLEAHDDGELIQEALRRAGKLLGGG
jgi:hypothetical protein